MKSLFGISSFVEVIILPGGGASRTPVIYCDHKKAGLQGAAMRPAGKLI